VIVGLGFAGMLPGVPGIASLRGTDANEDAYRQNRSRQYKDSQRYAASDTQNANRAARLRVRPVASGVPTAAPSVVPAGNVVSGDTVSTPGSSMQPGVIAVSNPDLPAPDSVIDRTQVLDQPENGTVAGIPVISPPAIDTPISVIMPALPIINVPGNVAEGLDDPAKKEMAMQLVSSAENSSTNWKEQYAYIEDIRDGRGYTAGIIGFCSGTGDMLELVQHYTKLKPDNALAKYLPVLQKVNGTQSHTGLDPTFTADWKTAAKDTIFQQAQNEERDRVYFNPAVSLGKSDGLHALGQFAYYDAMVMHGPGEDAESFGGIRAAALKKAKTPAQGGDETVYLNAFLDARVAAMQQEAAHDDVSRVETGQRDFLKSGNLNLTGPLTWKVYGETFTSK
jgi:chitosanase